MDSGAFGIFYETCAESVLASLERYANAFLVDDYPELQALGGKKDKGMDARVYNNETSKIELVVQSCVSPATAARTKVLKTLEKLKGNMPEVFIYCTSVVVGTALDETKRDLRKNHKVTLDVYDATWFTQRQKTSRRFVNSESGRERIGIQVRKHSSERVNLDT